MIAFESGAQVIDLVPDHDPEISVLVGLRSDGFPMCNRDLLDPLNPDRIVDVPKFVDVLGPSDED